MEEDDWSSELPVPSAALSASSSADPNQAMRDDCQADRNIDASGHECPTSGVMDQPLSAAAAKHVEGSAQPDMTDDLSILFLSSLSLCSPSACQPMPFPEVIQASEQPTFGGQQQPTCREEAIALSLPDLEPARPEQCEASGCFVNVLPQPDGQHSMPSSSRGSISNVDDSRQGAVIDQPARGHAGKLAAFMNVLPSLNDGSSEHSSNSNAIPRADSKGWQHSDSQTALDPGLPRREVFRQKRAAAQSARLGTNDRSGPAVSSPGATAFANQPMPNGTSSIAEEHHSEACMPPLGQELLHIANADAHDSVKISSGPALASPVPATLPCAAASPDQRDRTPSDVSAEAGLAVDAPKEGSSCASSQPGEAILGAGGLPHETADGSTTGVQWAENTAAGDSNDEPEEASALAIRRMSAAVRQSVPAAVPAQSTIPSSTAATALTVDQLHGVCEEADNAERAQGSPRGSRGDLGCGMPTMPDEAADHKDTAVRWAGNGAGVEAEGTEEPDEALRHAIRRMSMAARERASCHTPVDGVSPSTTGLKHAKRIPPRNVQHSTAGQQISRSDLSAPPSLRDAAKRAASPATGCEVGTGQDAEGSLPSTSMRSTYVTGPVHGPHAEQAPASPAQRRASFEQLLAPFNGCPAPERCSTPSPGPAARPAAQRSKGGRQLLLRHSRRRGLRVLSRPGLSDYSKNRRLLLSLLISTAVP